MRAWGLFLGTLLFALPLCAQDLLGPSRAQVGQGAIYSIPRGDLTDPKWAVTPVGASLQTSASAAGFTWIAGENADSYFCVVMNFDRSIVLSFAAKGGGETHVLRALATVVGGGPNPEPGPGPGPGPQPGPAPIPEAGFRVLIVYESADMPAYPIETQIILSGQDVRDFLSAHCVMEGGHPGWRMYDQNMNVASDLEVWRKAMDRPRTSVPWVVISNGQSGFEGPLPKGPTEFLDLCKRYLPTK